MNFFSSFFGRDPKDLFLSYSPLDSHWRIVSWNFDVKEENERQWTIESHKEHKDIIIWNKKDVETVQFFKDDHLLRRRRIPRDSGYKDLMNISIHTTLKYSLESNHAFMLSPVSGATTSDYQNEAKFLQWIQASFGTVSRSLERFKTDDSLILTGAVFSGITPESQENVLRVIIFNLDIFFYMRTDQTLQIAVFDDKNQGHGSSRTPVFQQIIKVTKPQFYDEIVRLVHQIATVGELR